MIALIVLIAGAAYIALAAWLSHLFSRWAVTSRSKWSARGVIFSALALIPFIDLPVVRLVGPGICASSADEIKTAATPEGSGINLGHTPHCATQCLTLLKHLNRESNQGYVEAFFSRTADNLSRDVDYTKGMSPVFPVPDVGLSRLEIVAERAECDHYFSVLQRYRDAGRDDIARSFDGIVGPQRCIKVSPIERVMSPISLEQRYKVENYPVIKVTRSTEGLVDRTGNFVPLNMLVGIRGDWVVGKIIPPISEFGNQYFCELKRQAVVGAQ
ncbi:hypothetical protein [Ferrovibrio sp.]|uniref:hypothetical protein n=1 Tax=Ferrovibrio sp. TaxID=1917215 RepID=UPI0025C4BE42|nr:hypothetical protein [Ferrovibrio sp.]